MFDYLSKTVKSIKKNNPLVLNITNDVTMDFIANGLLSIGASPIMSKACEEMEDLIRIAHVVVINLGTLDEKFLRLCAHVGEIANRLQKPIILDPVGAGASHYRTAACLKLLNQYQIAIIRGNAGEILALSGSTGFTKGVDSAVESSAVLENAQHVAHTFSAVVVVSGKKDLVVEGKHAEFFSYGSELMPLLTGSGCLLSAVTAAFHAVEKNPFKAAAEAVIFYGMCGEKAASETAAPGTFKIKFLDALHLLPEKKWYEKN